MWRYSLLSFILIVLLETAALAGLTPNDVVVVYNSSTTNPDWSVSKRVADYYCAARGIPPENELGVNWPFGSANQPFDGEAISDPAYRIQLFRNNVLTPLKDFLQTRFGADPDDPASCRAKAIVLCYGVPASSPRIKSETV